MNQTADSRLGQPRVAGGLFDVQEELVPQGHVVCCGKESLQEGRQINTGNERLGLARISGGDNLHLDCLGVFDFFQVTRIVDGEGPDAHPLASSTANVAFGGKAFDGLFRNP